MNHTYEEAVWLRSNIDEIIIETVGNQIAYLNYNNKQIEQSYKDAVSNIMQLAAAVELESLPSFLDYVLWLSDLLIQVGLPKRILISHLELLKNYIENHHGSTGLSVSYLKEAISAISSDTVTYKDFVCANSPYQPLKDAYLEALLHSDRNTAVHLIINAINSQEISIADLYLDVFTNALYDIGVLWQKRKISVGHEHYVSLVTEHIMSMLSYKIHQPSEDSKRMMGLCVGDEMHQIGIRMVCDLYELNHWKTFYLGANTPTDSILNAIERIHPNILALSASLTTHVPICEEIIKLIKTDHPTLKIIVGGRAFNLDPDLYKKVGADGYSPNGLEAVKLGESFIKPNPPV